MKSIKIETPREWLSHGGGGFEGGPEGLKSMTVSGEGLISFMEDYLNYLGSRFHELTGYDKPF